MDKETEKIKKKLKMNSNKNAKKIRISKIGLLLLIVLILVYVIYITYKLIIEPTNIFTVEEGSLYQQETSIGYVVRSEVVAQGQNYKNGIEPIKSEGEKASKNENIFKYYSKNEEKLEKKIDELNLKIQEAMQKETTIYAPDLKQIEDQIDFKLQQIINLTNVTEIEECKKDIDELILEKAKMTGDLSPSGTYLNKLIEERKSYENQLNSGSEYVTAPISGIVSYKVDGYEEVLTPSNLLSLTIEYLEGLKINTGQIIATNEEKGKVIDNFKYYIATTSISEEAKTAKINDNVKVRMINGQEIKAEIIKISEEDNGKFLILLELEKGIELLTDYRKITFDLIWWKDTGLKVPNESIENRDGLNYILRNREGYITELLVKVERQGDKYSIVQPYSNEELQKMGYTTQEIINYKKITVYDEVLLHNNKE